ncbi:hypothetical protein AKJ16_DCAP00992 [Drosera capensis]
MTKPEAPARGAGRWRPRQWPNLGRRLSASLRRDSDDVEGVEKGRERSEKARKCPLLDFSSRQLGSGLVGETGSGKIWPEKGAELSTRLFPASRSGVEGRAMPDLDWVECSKFVTGFGFVSSLALGFGSGHRRWLLVADFDPNEVRSVRENTGKVEEGCCRGRASQNPTRRWWLSYKTKTERRRNKTKGLMIGVEWSLGGFGD